MPASHVALLWLHLAVAAWFDVRERRIPNALIVSGLAQAYAVALFDGGVPDAGRAVLGAAVGMLAFAPLFAFRLIGAGDAKLMGVVGAFAGAPALLPIIFYTVLAGGVLGIAALALNRAAASPLVHLREALFAHGGHGHGARPVRRPAPVRKSAAVLPYALAIAAGVVCWALTRG